MGNNVSLRERVAGPASDTINKIVCICCLLSCGVPHSFMFPITGHVWLQNAGLEVVEDSREDFGEQE